MRAAIFARVSSDGQHVETQLLQLQAQAARDGAEVVAVYVDDGVSGRTGNLHARTDTLRMLADVDQRPRPWDRLYVVDFDRFGRSEDVEEQARVVGPLQRAGIEIHTRNGEQPALSTSIGRIMFHLQSEASADWLDKHRARIKAGKERAIAAGRKPAGPTPWGLRYERATGAWTVDEPAAAIVRECFRRVAGDDSCEAIAVDLEERGVERARADGWTRHAVWRLVRSEVYRGRFVVDKARDRAVPVPAIVEDETWYAAQRALLAHGLRGLRRTKHVYLLEGLATCALCGAPIGINSARQREGQVGYYLCSSKRRRGGRCALPMHRTRAVDEAVWGDVARVLVTPRMLERAIAARGAESSSERHDWLADLRGYERRLAQLARAEGEVLERFRRGLVSAPAMDRHLEAGSRERALLERQVETARRAAATASSTARRAEGVIASLATLRARVEGATPEVRRELAVLLLGRDGGRPVLLGPSEVRGRIVIGQAGAASYEIDHEANDVVLPLRVKLAARR